MILIANPILKYKGTYRLLPELCLDTMDFPRKLDGGLEDIDVYISCQLGNKIKHYGHIKGKRPVWYVAYIPSIGRGRNIKKALDEKNVEYIDYYENDEESEFKFQAKDMEIVAGLLKAKTSGASISPFSNKNLPKSKYEISLNEIEEYKQITAQVQKQDLLILSQITNRFLTDILQKKYKRIDIKADMKKKCMARQNKEYIHSMGMWNEYLKYMKQEINKFYKEKSHE